MAIRLLKVPSDLSFQKTYDKFRHRWWCKELTCEQYPDLRIRLHGRAGRPEITQYTVLDSDGDAHSFPSFRTAYSFLMSRPRRVTRESNKPRQYASADRSHRKAT